MKINSWKKNTLKSSTREALISFKSHSLDLRFGFATTHKLWIYIYGKMIFTRDTTSKSWFLEKKRNTFLLFWKWLQPQKPFSKPILFFVVIVWEKDLHLSFKDKEKFELEAISLLFISRKDVYIYCDLTTYLLCFMIKDNLAT